MKIVTWILGLVTVIVLGVYLLIFSSLGNGILQPIIEKQIQEQTLSSTKLKIFSLSMSDFDILIELNQNNTIHLNGTYSLYSQSFKIVYDLKLEELKTLKKLTQTQLQSSFRTDGTVVGDLAFIKIDGKSDVANGKTSYSIELTKLNPTSIITKIQNIDLQALLFMLNQKQYASASINVDVNFKNITPHQLDGNILFITNNGTLNTKVLKKDFAITIPKNTAFNMNLDATLKGDDVDYKYILNSNLAKISSGGKITPEPLALNIKYGLNIKELALLKVITGADVRGSLKLDGNVKGTKERLIVDGKTDFAESKTKFIATLTDFIPKNLEAEIKGLKLQKALYMIKQPHYSDGYFDLDVMISNLDMKNLQGIVKSKIYKGKLDSKYLSKTYEFKTVMPRVNFDATTYTTLNKDIIDTKVDFNSNLANLDVKNAKFKLGDGSLVSDYKVELSDLDKFYFASDRHLKGALVARGTVKKAKDLDFKMHSDIANGALNVNLHNDDLTATLKDMKTLKVLDMLLYPKIFDSLVSGDVKYNLLKEKGTFKGKLSDGRFTKNQVLDLTKKFAEIDLYKEIFKGDVNANINKEKIVGSLSLKSNKSSISTKNAKLNSKTQIIHSKLDIVANKNPFSVTLDGDVNSPDVKVNANALMKKEAKKAIKKGINKYLKGLF